MDLIIIIICVTYYILGFVALSFLWKSMSQFGDEGLYLVLTVFGLGIIPIICLVSAEISLRIEKHTSNKGKQKVNIYTTSLNNGIIKTNNYLAYNFPDEKYMGVIEIDVRNISYEEINKIIDKLNKWAENEIKKIAKIRALEEINKNSM
jgi:hypothetical protein